MFVPAVVVTRCESAAEQPVPGCRPATDPGAGVIELEIAGIMVRIGRGADAATVAAVIRGVKAAS